MKPLSIRETFRGRHILITGGSGFVGKVWLAMMLERVPEIARIYVLIRGRGRSAQERFERLVNTSPSFKPLHDAHGAGLSEFLRGRIEVIEGDVSHVNMGMDDVSAQRLRNTVDIVINCAGLVDFNPDLRDALSANVEGARLVADFVQSCKNAGLVHISTCYVAGQNEGLCPETAEHSHSPDGMAYDIDREYEVIQELVRSVVEENDSNEVHDQIRHSVVDRIRERGMEEKETRIRAMAQRLHRRRTKEALIQAGTDRSMELGWPNTYTYTKAMAEALLVARGDKLRYSIVRPAIVESAREFPFPGWNEGFNTSGPLVYLAGTWLRHIPSKADNVLDVVPVDEVCNAMTIAAAALIRGENRPVYHCGSSDLNPLTMKRIFELSALAHRRHLRKKGTNRRRRMLLPRWDIVITTPENVANVGNIRRAVHQVTRFLRHGLPSKIPWEVRDKADDLARAGDTTERRLRQIEEVMKLFQPFIHDHTFTFETRALREHKVVEPEFAFAPDTIKWREYWMNVHVPGLRRWCFPEYEGKEREKYQAEHAFELLPAADGANEEAG